MKLSNNQQQEIIDDMLMAYKYSDNDFPVVADLSKLPKGFKGVAMEINDHGNITIWNVFKNGNCREIASRV